MSFEHLVLYGNENRLQQTIGNAKLFRFYSRPAEIFRLCFVKFYSYLRLNIDAVSIPNFHDWILDILSSEPEFIETISRPEGELFF
jgi:hypothetical protein